MEQEKKTVEKSGIGTVKIADEVVTLIVAYAALDVDGVAGPLTFSAITDLKERTFKHE